MIKKMHTIIKLNKVLRRSAAQRETNLRALETNYMSCNYLLDHQKVKKKQQRKEQFRIGSRNWERGILLVSRTERKWLENDF